MSFWERYEELCREKEISPSGSEMVNLLGVSSAGITYWKQNNSGPKKFDIYEKLAKYFDVDIRYLMGISDSRHGEDIVEAAMDRLTDAGVEIHTYDKDTGSGQEYLLIYKNKSYTYFEHAFKLLCAKLMSEINNAEIFTVEKFVMKNFAGKDVSKSAATDDYSDEEKDLIESYRKLTREGKTMVNAAIIQEIRRQSADH